MELRQQPVPFLSEGQVLIKQDGLALDQPDSPLLTRMVEDLFKRYLPDGEDRAEG